MQYLWIVKSFFIEERLYRKEWVGKCLVALPTPLYDFNLRLPQVITLFTKLRKNELNYKQCNYPIFSFSSHRLKMSYTVVNDSF